MAFSPLTRNSLAVVHSHTWGMRRGRLLKGVILPGSPCWVLLSAGFPSVRFLLCSRTWRQQLHFYVFSVFFILGMDFLFLLWYSGLVARMACPSSPGREGKKAEIILCYAT